MAEKFYNEIDEEFNYLGDKYKVVESFDVREDCCVNCDLFKYCVPGPEDSFEEDVIFLCNSDEREDHKEVFFKKVEK